MLYKKNRAVLIKKKRKQELLKSKLMPITKFNHSIKSVSILIPVKWKCVIFKDSANDFYVFYLNSIEYNFKFALTAHETCVFYCFNTNLVTLLSKNWGTSITM